MPNVAMFPAQEPAPPLARSSRHSLFFLLTRAAQLPPCFTYIAALCVSPCCRAKVESRLKYWDPAYVASKEVRSSERGAWGSSGEGRNSGHGRAVAPRYRPSRSCSLRLAGLGALALCRMAYGSR